MNKVKSDSNNSITRSDNVVIDLLYLDLSVCTRCQGTESSLEDSLESLIELLQSSDREVKFNKIHIETKEQAIQHHFVSSPTIRVNGKDIQMKVKESHCSTCSSLTDGASVDCRVWVYKDKEYSVPPKTMIIDAVLNIIYNTKEMSEQEDHSQYRLSKNLIEYFEKKDQLCANVTPSESSSCGSC